MHGTFWQIMRSLVPLRTNVLHSAQRRFLGMTGKQHENAFRNRTCKSFLFYYLLWGFSQRFSKNHWTQDGFSLRDEKKCFLSYEAKRNYESTLLHWKIASANIRCRLNEKALSKDLCRKFLYRTRHRIAPYRRKGVFVSMVGVHTYWFTTTH